MLNTTQRLSTNQVSWLLKKGFKFNSEFFSVKFHLNKLSLSRYSIVVSKKVEPLATDRNYIRRQLYEIIRTSPFLEPPADYIIMVKPGITKLSFSEKQQLLLTTLAQISSKLK